MSKTLVPMEQTGDALLEARKRRSDLNLPEPSQQEEGRFGMSGAAIASGWRRQALR